MKKLYLLPFMLLVLMAACNDVDEPVLEQAKSDGVNFRASIGQNSRATETAFEQGDAISVFAVDPAVGMGLKPSGNYADNFKYIYGDARFAAESDAISIGEGNTAGLGYYAIYPYSSSASNKFTFTVKSDQSNYSDYTQSDLCTAFASQTTEKTVNLEFNHRLSNILIKFYGENITSQDIKVSLENVYTSCDVDINANTYMAKGNKGKVIMGKESSNTFRAIIAPQTVSSKVAFMNVTLNGKSKLLSLKSNFEFKSGKQTVFEYEIANNQLVELNGYINPWDTEDELAVVDGMDDPEKGIVVLQESTKGNHLVDVVIMGDGFAAEHFSNGNYDRLMRKAADSFFSVEPYASLREYFNVYYINAISEENHDAVPYYDSYGNQNGASMGDAVTKFSTVFEERSTAIEGNESLVSKYVLQTLMHKGGRGGTPVTDEPELNYRFNTVLVIMPVNVKCYAGMTSVYFADNSDYGDYGYSPSIAYVSLGNDDTGEQFRLTTIHEACGHGFGKLADEYFYQPTTQFNTQKWIRLREVHNLGHERNVNEYWTKEEEANWNGLTWEYTTEENVYWAELLRPEYSYTQTEGLSMYKGANYSSNLFCRPTDKSLMRSQFDKDGQSFNAISRWAIWYRLMKLAGGAKAKDFKSSLNEFIAFDKTIQGWGGTTGARSGNYENFVEKKLPPLAPPVIKKAKWVNGRILLE